jgi:hypothetical protein
MDEIVKQALAKWPNVPHCYGWLALDARGGWRMRDERTQALNLPGDRIVNPALLAFINRNYTHDEQGRWYFQNGPQRVYVDLEAAPYIARTDPSRGFMLHTGDPLAAIDEAWLTDTGQLLFKSGDVIALLDDRDMSQCLGAFSAQGNAVSDDQFLSWMERPGDTPLTYEVAGRALPVRHIARDAIAARFDFISEPRSDSP